MSPVRAAALLMFVLMAPLALAAPQERAGKDRQQASAYAEGLSLDQAVAKVEKKYDARVVRAEESTEDGRRVYRIRLLSTEGRVFDVKVDAASGRVE